MPPQRHGRRSPGASDLERYSLVILRRPANGGRSVADPELQRQHLGHLTAMARAGSWSWPVRSMTRPILGCAGCASTALHRGGAKLAQEDPAVKAGRLEVEALSWWVRRAR